MSAKQVEHERSAALNEWHRAVVEWRDFYALVGTAGATFMGLTFVVITLSPKTIIDREDAVKSYTTPIMAFFTTIVVLSVFMLVPRLSSNLHALAFAILGAVGIFYMCTTGTYQSWKKSELGFDDLLWYVLWPFLAYVALLVAALEIWRGNEIGLYIGGGASLFFLIIGIRNAWDVVLAVARISAGGEP